MVWTQLQTTAFFTDPDQMGLKANAVTALNEEGITSVNNPGSFEDVLWTTIVNNLKHPVTVLTPGADPADPMIETRGVVIHIGWCTFPIKAETCFLCS